MDDERFNLIDLVSLENLPIETSVKGRSREICGLARFGFGRAGDLCFCDREPDAKFTRVSPGSLVLCRPELVSILTQRFPDIVCLPANDPRAVFIDLGHRLLAEGKLAVSSAVPRPLGIHTSVKIGERTVIHPEVRIDEGVTIGAQCVVHRGTWIQAGSIVRDNTVIGVEGINAYLGQDGRQRNFPHFASVIIGKNVEIGAGAIVVRGIVNSTRIGAGTVIGNLCNVGHGVEIGQKVWMSVGCLIGGHTRIDDGATLGMGVAVRDNIKVGANTQIGMASAVVKSIPDRVSVFGNPGRIIAPIQAGPNR